MSSFETHMPSLRLFRLLVELLAAAVAVAALAAPAVASSHKPARHPAVKTLRLRPEFHRLGSAEYLLSTGRYVFAATSSASPPLGLLIDEQTGKRTQLSLPTDCDYPTGPEILGGPWLLVTCASAQSRNVELYTLSSGQWVTVIPAPSVQQFCQEAGMSSCDPVAVGADWIEFDETCYHCVHTYVFQNVQTGELRGDPRNATTVVDLSSASLAKPVCRPLRVPRSGSLVFDGSFAVAQSSGSVSRALRHALAPADRAHQRPADELARDRVAIG